MQVNAINAALGAKVADFRRAHGWSQAHLAQLFGDALGRPIDATTITRLEQGKRPVPVHELIELSRILAVEPTVFFKFLGPLDDAVAAAKFRTSALTTQAQLAGYEAEAAARQLECLEALQAFRDDPSQWKALTKGSAILFLPAHFWRGDWRELFLDAGVPPDALETASKAVPGAPIPEDATDSTSRFMMAVLDAVFGESKAPVKRARRG